MAQQINSGYNCAMPVNNPNLVDFPCRALAVVDFHLLAGSVWQACLTIKGTGRSGRQSLLIYGMYYYL